MVSHHPDALREKKVTAHATPQGLRVTERLLVSYRSLQDRYAAQQLDELGLDRVAERLERRILKACELFPWTPSEIYYWTWAWLHLMSYGQEATTRKRFQAHYGPMPGKRGPYPAWDGVTWVLQYPDIEMIVDLLDDADRHRHRVIP